MATFAMETPPPISGNPEADIVALRNYLEELIEEIEYVFSELDKN